MVVWPGEAGVEAWGQGQGCPGSPTGGPGHLSRWPGLASPRLSQAGGRRSSAGRPLPGEPRRGLSRGSRWLLAALSCLWGFTVPAPGLGGKGCSWGRDGPPQVLWWVTRHRCGEPQPHLHLEVGPKGLHHGVSRGLWGPAHLEVGGLCRPPGTVLGRVKGRAAKSGVWLLWDSPLQGAGREGCGSGWAACPAVPSTSWSEGWDESQALAWVRPGL